MKNKYDFEDLDAEKVLKILYPSISAISMNMDDLEGAMAEVGAETSALVVILKKIEELEFLDEFEVIKEEWNTFGESFFAKILDLQMKEEVGKPYYVFMQFYQVDELIKVVDDFIINSNTNVNVTKTPIQDIDGFRVSLIEKVNIIGNDLDKLFMRDNSLTVFLQQWRKIVRDKITGAAENELFDFIIMFEEYNGSDKIEYERFWAEKTVQLSYELMSRMLALLSFTNFLDEFRFEDQ